MAYHTVNLEQNYPTANQATVRLSQELRLAKTGRKRALKIIHGYGSSGKGGTIKIAVHRMLGEKKRSGFIQHYVAGENFTAFTNDGRKAVELCPELKQDADFSRQNDGITIVIF